MMGEHPKTLEEIADEQFVAAINSAFRMGARACREMMARFVEQGPPTDPKTLAGSIRANWSPHWGDDAGPPDEYPVELGALEARVDAEKFAASAVAKALTMLDDEPMTAPTPDELCARLKQVRDLIEDPAFITVATGFARYNADERDLVLRSAIEAADLIQQQQATIERLSAALEIIERGTVDDAFGKPVNITSFRMRSIACAALQARAAIAKRNAERGRPLTNRERLENLERGLGYAPGTAPWWPSVTQGEKGR